MAKARGSSRGGSVSEGVFGHKEKQAKRARRWKVW